MEAWTQGRAGKRRLRASGLQTQTGRIQGTLGHGWSVGKRNLRLDLLPRWALHALGSAFLVLSRRLRTVAAGARCRRGRPCVHVGAETRLPAPLSSGYPTSMSRPLCCPASAAPRVLLGGPSPQQVWLLLVTCATPTSQSGARGSSGQFWKIWFCSREGRSEVRRGRGGSLG